MVSGMVNPDGSPGFMVNAPCFTICHAWVKLGMLNPNVRKPCLMVKSLCDHHVLMVESIFLMAYHPKNLRS